ncbi:MAG: YbjQ family protein [Candidatus Cloacimonetes bacterium]|nr:YbjQ family protein [Candidatus Cloacimonadota bacterium]
MEDFIALIIQISVIVLLVFIGYYFGRKKEKNHLKSLAIRESKMKDIMVLNLKNPPEKAVLCGLVIGEVVIANDYFKTMMAGLRNLFGGELTSYVTLVDRARREAKLRLLEHATKVKGNLILNVRFETSTIAGRSNNKNNSGSGVEILAYGTAYHLKHD